MLPIVKLFAYQVSQKRVAVRAAADAMIEPAMYLALEYPPEQPMDIVIPSISTWKLMSKTYSFMHL
jgi:hypothetical protein